MKKLTDEQVAKALGWKFCGGLWEPSRAGEFYTNELPCFTTSLDAIVAEVEARGLDWGFDTRGNCAFVEGHRSLRDFVEASGDTPALALCAALLAYLKEKP